MLFATPRLTERELEVVARIDDLKQALRHATAERRLWTGLLRRNALARAIRGSNTIEGYTVSLDDALDVAQGDAPREPDAVDPETRAAVTGYRNAMTYVLQLADDPHFRYDESLLRSLHFMMLSYDLGKMPGRWRPGYIAVRDDTIGRIVYEGPDADLVPSLVEELVAELRMSDSLPPVIRAAMAHLNLVMIHPFKDGNGRMARALQTLVLTREGVLAPEFCSIEEYLGANTRAYYDVLAEVGGGSWQPQRDARPWMRFCLTAHYRQARTHQNRVWETARLWDLLEIQVRERGLPERMLYALFDAASGFRVHNARYRSLAELTLTAASRDLRTLVGQGLLVAHGEARGRSYVGSPSLLGLRDEARRARRPIEDPFEGGPDPRQLVAPL
jgi:Fic family protein